MTTLDIENTKAERFIHALNSEALLIDFPIQPLQESRHAPANLTGLAPRPSISPGAGFARPART
jgi:hypothetical protein